jgi:hypothetical protein
MADAETTRIIRTIGRALWRLDTPRGATMEERRASWGENRRTYMLNARKLQALLEREGLYIAGGDEEAEAETEAQPS